MKKLKVLFSELLVLCMVAGFAPLHATARVGIPRPYRNRGLRQPELHSGTWASTGHEAASGHPEIPAPRVCAAGYRAGEAESGRVNP